MRCGGTWYKPGMRKTLLLTVVGADRTGLVESLAGRIAESGANWEESKLARLAGQFAGIVLVTVPAERADALIAGLRALDAKGLQVTARVVEAPAPAASGEDLRVVVTGNDRPGIVRDVSRILAERGVNVEELETAVESAPMSGEALFVARARIRMPPGMQLGDLRTALETLGNELVVDVGA
jgi:glycine cleavage system regulatory protein